MVTTKALSPVKMISDAFDLFEVGVAASVRRLEEKELIPSSTTSFFLIGSAIELALMCYLSHKGFGNEDLVNINHDLELALEKANTHGLQKIASLSDDFIGSVKELNAEFKYQNIQKANINPTQLNVFHSLQGGALQLLAVIAAEVGVAELPGF